MIGKLDIEEPSWEDHTRAFVDGHRTESGQGYAAIQTLGVWGSVDQSPDLRLYAGYQHIKDNPEDGAAWLELASIHREMGEWNRAEAIIREVKRVGDLGLYPDVFLEDADAHLALIYAEVGTMDEALSALNAIAERHTTLPIFHYLRASVLHTLKRFPEAAGEYKEALRHLEEGRDYIENDFDAIFATINKQMKQAEKSEPFSGPRSLDMAALEEE